MPRVLIGEVAALGSTQGIQVADALLGASKKKQRKLASDLKDLDFDSQLAGYNLAEASSGTRCAARIGRRCCRFGRSVTRARCWSTPTSTNRGEHGARGDVAAIGHGPRAWRQADPRCG